MNSCWIILLLLCVCKNDKNNCFCGQSVCKRVEPVGCNRQPDCWHEKEKKDDCFCRKVKRVDEEICSCEEGSNLDEES